MPDIGVPSQQMPGRCDLLGGGGLIARMGPAIVVGLIFLWRLGTDDRSWINSFRGCFAGRFFARMSNGRIGRGVSSRRPMFEAARY